MSFSDGTSSDEEEFQLTFKPKSQRVYQEQQSEVVKRYAQAKQQRLVKAKTAFESNVAQLFESSIAQLHNDSQGVQFGDILEDLASLSCSDSDGDADTEMDEYRQREILRVKRYLLRKEAIQNGQAIQIILGTGHLIVDSENAAIFD